MLFNPITFIIDFFQPKFVGIALAVGAVASAAMAAEASDNASDNAYRAAREADPFREERPFYQQKLKGLMSNPTAFSKDPLYGFLSDQGTQAIRRGMGPGYGGEGGNVMGELQRFGQLNAYNYAMPYYNLLATLGGANYNNPSMGGAANAQMMNGQNQIDAINQGMSGLGILGGTLYDKYGKTGQSPQTQSSYGSGSVMNSPFANISGGGVTAFN